MELKDLVGQHKLDAVDFLTEKIKDYCDEMQDCNCIRFRLDGIVYVAIEDPDDGFRSSMRELKTAESSTMTNVFTAARVIGRHRTKGECGEDDDVLELVDANTGEIIIKAGTRNVGDYYPCFVATFRPEAMAINKPSPIGPGGGLRVGAKLGKKGKL
jgi:hypothetical protein